jgi:CBS domain-containing protein
LSEVVDILLKHGLPGAPVVDGENRVVGFVSEQDCLAPLLVSSYHCEGEKRVNEVMFSDVVSVHPDDALIGLAKRMSGKMPKQYPVIEQGKLVGLITRSDVLRALSLAGKACRSSN